MMEIVNTPPAVDALDGPDALMDAWSSLKVSYTPHSPYKAMAQHCAYGVHMNFFARKKDGDSSPVLFYDDLLSSPAYEEDEIECCILNPSPISFDEFRPNGVGVGSSVYHPPYVIRCGYCEDMDKVMAKYELDSDDSDDGIDMF
ncbi:uncharacterized protein LOC110708042 [Chenopodium quinoa]|uniref:uncharacterized protein LOC110708042 n=1 Tax=Chenopodium quinoa TaxID=63459 RepID=UPI000B7915FA|nr:uncharacterized protein LOC110708042 [Chenopodium quinoa]